MIVGSTELFPEQRVKDMVEALGGAPNRGSVNKMRRKHVCMVSSTEVPIVVGKGLTALY